MSNIHATAIVSQKAEIGKDNKIGPHVIIEDNVKIGSGNTFMAGSYICGGTEIGDNNEFHMNAIVGHSPQDLSYDGESTFTKIGNRNKIREFVTIHRGTKEGSSTLLGDDNYIMAYCHIAHNCEIGNNVIMVNQASLTGHCIVEDKAFLSGMTGFHQFTRIGTLSMISALSAINKDIPPFMICGGRPAVVLGINVIGLRRAGIQASVRDEIKQAYKLLYRSGLNITQALTAIKENYQSAEVKHLVEFIEKSERGICDGAGTEVETLKARK